MSKDQAHITAFARTPPTLEESLVRIADCLEYFMQRQMELDRLAQEQQIGSVQESPYLRREEG